MNKVEEKNTMETDKKEKINEKPDETGNVSVEGHIRIFDPVSGEEFVNKRNAIHYENMSEAMPSY